MGQPQSKNNDNEFFIARDFNEPKFASKIEETEKELQGPKPRDSISSVEHSSLNDDDMSELQKNQESIKKDAKKISKKAVELKDVPLKKKPVQTTPDIFSTEDSIFEGISQNARTTEDLFGLHTKETEISKVKSLDTFDRVSKKPLNQNPTPQNQPEQQLQQKDEPKEQEEGPSVEAFKKAAWEEDEEGLAIEDEDFDTEILCDWLTKQTVMNYGKDDERVKNTSPWKNRLFILKRGCLYYYVVEDVGKFDINEKITITRETSAPELLPRGRGKEPVVGYTFNIAFPDSSGGNFFEVHIKQNIFFN